MSRPGLDLTVSLRILALSEEYEFIILFDTFSWFPQELTKYEIGSRLALIGLNFLDKDVLYTIEEAIDVLKT